MTLKSCDKWDGISSSIEACIADMLKLNKDMAEFIVFSSKQHVKKTENLRIKLGSSYINSSMSVRNLGLLFRNISSITILFGM